MLPRRFYFITVGPTVTSERCMKKTRSWRPVTPRDACVQSPADWLILCCEPQASNQSIFSHVCELWASLFIIISLLSSYRFDCWRQYHRAFIVRQAQQLKSPYQYYSLDLGLMLNMTLVRRARYIHDCTSVVDQDYAPNPLFWLPFPVSDVTTITETRGALAPIYFVCMGTLISVPSFSVFLNRLIGRIGNL